MNWEAWSTAAELVGAIAVVASLLYLARQVRESTKTVSAQSRHSLSEFVLQVSMFRAEHADRYAKLESGEPLTAGDLQFRHWSHMQVTLHAESYFRHHELGLMPEHHWSGYAAFLNSYLDSPGFREFWTDVGYGFSAHFREWIDGLLAKRDAPPAAT